MTLQDVLYKAYLKNHAEISIIDNQESISYNELYMKVSCISCYLSCELKFSQKIIPLIFVTSKFYIYSILGLVFSKNIFMPIDATHPINKIKKYLLTVKTDYIITEKNLPVNIISLCEEMDIKIVYIEDILCSNKLSTNFSFDFDRYNKDDAIYVYFTSGTTGEPKAVLGVNKSLLHFIEWEKQEFQVTEKDVFAQITSPAFDPYLRDIFTPLCSGAKICLVNRNIVLVPHLLGDFLKNSEVTFWHTTPTILKNLIKTKFGLDHFAKIRYILIAGELLPAWVVRYWYSHYKNYSVLVNMYGPTECTLAKVFARLPYTFSEDSVPLGTPICDTNIYIKNNENSYETANDVIGEICIETEYVTYGYLNEDKDLFFSLNNSRNLYHTGDIGYFKDNVLYFVGRKDEQKKIGGVRIYLNEIASKILYYNKAQIKDCVVIYKDNKLVAFYTAEEVIDFNKIHKFLENFLLPIHIPHKFIKVNNIPFTENGKVDKNKLIKEHHLDIKERVFKIVGSILSVDLNETNINVNLQNIGMDSIGYVNLVVELENSFGIEIPDEEFSISRMNTLKQIVCIVEKELANM